MSVVRPFTLWRRGPIRIYRIGLCHDRVGVVIVDLGHIRPRFTLLRGSLETAMYRRPVMMLLRVRAGINVLRGWKVGYRAPMGLGVGRGPLETQPVGLG